MNVVNVGYDSTNYYLLEQNNVRVLIDVGWPGTLLKLLANLKRKGIELQTTRYLLITHYHPDHAGLAQFAPWVQPASTPDMARNNSHHRLQQDGCP